MSVNLPSEGIFLLGESLVAAAEFLGPMGQNQVILPGPGIINHALTGGFPDPAFPNLPKEQVKSLAPWQRVEQPL